MPHVTSGGVAEVVIQRPFCIAHSPWYFCPTLPVLPYNSTKHRTCFLNSSSHSHTNVRTEAGLLQNKTQLSLEK